MPWGIVVGHLLGGDLLERIKQGSVAASTKGAVMTKDGLLALLQRTMDAVKADDSFEGRIVYFATGPGEFSVHAGVRVGNSMGQGGMILVEDTPPVEGLCAGPEA